MGRTAADGARRRRADRTWSSSPPGRPAGALDPHPVPHADDEADTSLLVLTAAGLGFVPVPFLAMYALLFLLHGLFVPVQPPDITTTRGGEALAGLVALVLLVAFSWALAASSPAAALAVRGDPARDAGRRDLLPRRRQLRPVAAAGGAGADQPRRPRAGLRAAGLGAHRPPDARPARPGRRRPPLATASAERRTDRSGRRRSRSRNT